MARAGRSARRGRKPYLKVRIPRPPQSRQHAKAPCHHRLRTGGSCDSRPEEGRGRRGVAAVERKVEQTGSQVDRLKKDLDRQKNSPMIGKEKKAKTKAVDKCKKDLEKAKGENEVAVKARDKPIQEALQRRIDKCQKLIDEAEKMPETNDQEKQMKLHRIEQCKRAKAKAEKERDKAFPKPKEAPASATPPAAADAKVRRRRRTATATRR